jgi:sporulation protein YlmC with PRC-barrel domain
MSMYDLDDAPNWRGRDVIDENGHPVGVITDLFVDEATGRPEWAGIRSALFSHRETFVPLSQATAHGMRVQVPYTQSHIHEAPSVDHHGHLSADEEARLYQHYGLDYGPVAPGAAPSGADSEFIAPATDRVDEEATAGTHKRHGLRLRRHVAADEDPDRAPGE